MRKDRNEAIEMRKDGKSYRQIRDKLRIPLSTISEWFSGEEWSLKIRQKLTAAAEIESTIRIVELDRVRGEHLKQAYEEARKEARQELETLRYNPLFIAGIMLYWGEGDKLTNGQTRLSNSDPELIRLYVEFLRKACRIPESKIKGSLLIYPDIDRESNLRFWSFASGIPISRFSKSVLINGKHETRRLRYGVCSILVLSTYFKVKMLEWLRFMPKELMNREYYENIGGTSMTDT
ncbi:MAG: hypothetical protein WBK28_00070 [Minisyncoccia bacterium]